MKIFGEPFFNEPMFDKSIEKEKIVQLSKHVGHFRPLVEKDAKVKKNQVIGLLLVAGIEEKIKAEVDGTIKEILPKYETGYTVAKREEQYNGEQAMSASVEYGQPLFVIEKKESSPTKTIK